MNRSWTTVIAISVAMGLVCSACIEEEDTESDAREFDYLLEGRATVRGTITLDPEIAQLQDGFGTLCVGLYDAELACPPTGSTPYRRQVGLFYVDTDLNADGEVPFVIHNVLPGTYALGSMFDADESGCYSQITGGDAMAASCLEFTVEANETVDLDPVPIDFELPVM